MSAKIVLTDETSVRSFKEELKTAVSGANRSINDALARGGWQLWVSDRDDFVVKTLGAFWMLVTESLEKVPDLMEGDLAKLVSAAGTVLEVFPEPNGCAVYLWLVIPREMHSVFPPPDPEEMLSVPEAEEENSFYDEKAQKILLVEMSSPLA